MNKAEVGTITRTVLLWLAIINQILTAIGKNPIPLDDMAVSTIITSVLAVWAWWKNNSFTHSAKLADMYLKEVKKVSKQTKNNEV